MQGLPRPPRLHQLCVAMLSPRLVGRKFGLAFCLYRIQTGPLFPASHKRGPGQTDLLYSKAPPSLSSYICVPPCDPLLFFGHGSTDSCAPKLGLLPIAARAKVISRLPDSCGAKASIPVPHKLHTRASRTCVLPAARTSACCVPCISRPFLPQTLCSPSTAYGPTKPVWPLSQFELPPPFLLVVLASTPVPKLGLQPELNRPASLSSPHLSRRYVLTACLWERKPQYPCAANLAPTHVLHPGHSAFSVAPL